MIYIPDEVKNLLKQDSVRKNFRVHFPNGERADITNENIVSESVTFTESICSQNNIKFGLCESPSIEFETFGVEKIKGYTIECYLEVYCDASTPGSVYKTDLDAYVYQIPYGIFTVDSCKKQSDMSHRRVIAYSMNEWKLPEYIGDTYANLYWIEKSLKVSIEAIMKMLIPSYNTNFVLDDIVSTSTNVRHTMTIADGTYRVTCFTKHNQPGRHTDKSQYIACSKTEYDNEFLRKVSELKNIITSFGLSDFLNLTYEISSTYPSHLSFSYQSTPTSGDFYSLSVKNQVVPSRYNNIWNIGNTAYAQPVYHLSKITDPTKMVSAWTLDTQATGIDAPYRYLLEKQNGSNWETIYDTEEADIKFYYDSNFTSIDVSDVGIYCTGNGSKQTITMIKSYNSSSGTLIRVEVEQNVYAFDFASMIDRNWQKYIEAFCELEGKFGYFTRYGTLDVISVNDAFDSTARIDMEDVKNIWYDDDETLPYGQIYCAYTNRKKEAKVYSLDIVDDYNPVNYKRYVIRENQIIDESLFTEAQIKAYLQKIANEINKIKFMPMELSMKGRPDIESGDVFNIEIDGQTIVCFVEKRNLTGIQNLTDGISSVEDNSDDDEGLTATYNDNEGILCIYTKK